MRDFNIAEDAQFLIVGAGQTNTNMLKFLHKHGFKNFTVYNRTIEKAQALAEMVNGEFKALSDPQKS